jgi:hypothetical protein
MKYLNSDAFHDALQCASVVCNLLISLCTSVVARQCASVRVSYSQIIEKISASGCASVRFSPPSYLPPLKGGIDTTPRRAVALGALALCAAPRSALETR